MRGCHWLFMGALSSTGWAGELVSGSAVRVHYSDQGVWNDAGRSAGLQALHDGEWVDYTWPGSPFNAWQLAWEDGGSAPEGYYITSVGPDTNTTVERTEDRSTDGRLIHLAEVAAGDVLLRKTETWDPAGRAILVHTMLENRESRELTDVRWFFAVDPDQDYAIDGVTNTLNRVVALDDDLEPDVVVSTGPETGRVLAFAPCERAQIGHYPGWSNPHGPDVELLDYEGLDADLGMGIRFEFPDLAPGERASASFFVVVGDSEESALATVRAALATCGDCDVDGDGALAPDCGGDDCDDEEPAAYPGGADVWYDGIDGDCDGASDFDADGDGHDSDAHGGDDCDDADPAINPSATEIPYDGVDSDCDGASDLDADGDGYDSAGHGGDDCNDGDAEVYPGAPEADGDGTDSNCDGQDGASDDELEVASGDCGCAAGPLGAMPVLGVLGMLALIRRRR